MFAKVRFLRAARVIKRAINRVMLCLYIVCHLAVAKVEGETRMFTDRIGPLFIGVKKCSSVSLCVPLPPSLPG